MRECVQPEEDCQVEDIDGSIKVKMLRDIKIAGKTEMARDGPLGEREREREMDYWRGEREREREREREKQRNRNMDHRRRQREMCTIAKSIIE